jgi:muramidase (phage lysozyme)
VVVRQETFLINGKPKPFGLAQRADGGDKFWISLRSEFLTEDGEAHILMPGWMKKAIAHGVYDQVVNPTVPVAIQAGDAVGFLSRNETSNDKTSPIRDTDWVAHIEVISTDENLLTFLGNPKHLRTGQQYVKLQGERPLYLKNGDGKNSAFTAMEGVVTQIDGGKILRREDTHPHRDAQDVTWFKIRPYTWMRQEDVTELSQHDLGKLGFVALQEASSDDFSRSLNESWVKQALLRFEQGVGRARSSKCAMASNFYQSLLMLADLNEDGGISGYDSEQLNEQLFRGLHYPGQDVPQMLRRLVVKHDSEWFGGSSHQRWRSFFSDDDRHLWPYRKQWLDDQEWMSQVPAFSEGKPVWHCHPTEFLKAIDTTEFITLEEARVRAFMRMIRVGEGTMGEIGYETLFGGQSFIQDYHKNFSNHPHISIRSGGLTSSAAGAYQVMAYTWNDKKMILAKDKYEIKDFTPVSQDKFCLVLLKIKRKGSLKKIISGDIDGAMDILSYEWASLPPGRYGQPSKNKKECIELYEKFLDEELKGKTDLHLAIGYLSGFLSED